MVEEEVTLKEIEEFSNKLIAEGKLIDAGFLVLQKLMIPEDANPAQIRDMRIAFFAGAQHLMSTIMTVLDPSEEPTEADMKKLENIMNELGDFGKEMKTIVKEYNEKAKEFSENQVKH